MAIEGIGQVNNYLTLVLIKFVDMSIVPWLILVIWPQLNGSRHFSYYYLSNHCALMIILGYTAQAKADREYDRFNRLSNHLLIHCVV
ncbi:Uncharacterised protein [Weissella viridescens]|uniref:Uncharacterized protein n=1 Tax=Weissella viridescens TaxID=1629 RepID=A0A380P9V2_WEIVI|nr:Uncharacterised protein [Weissella viridescens]